MTSKQKDKTKAGATQVAGIAGQRGMESARNAKLATDAIAASHVRQVADAASSAEFIRGRAGQIAADTAAAAAKGARSGAREQVKGHFIEGMAIRDYNASRRLVGKTLEAMPSPTHRAYDARRFTTVNGQQQFAGAVQVKSGAAGVEKAIAQIERVKPGSANGATLIVPDDQVAAATRKAAGRITVKGSGVTRTHSTKRLDKGVKAIAEDGASAASKAKALGKAGAAGAALGVAIGAAAEARALKNGEISARHFIENRGIDAGEGAAGGVLGAGAASLAGAGATAALGTTAGASFAASAGAAGTAVVGTIGTMGSGGAAVAGVLGTLSAPVVLPALAGIGASVVIGIGVSRGAKAIRKEVEKSRVTETDPIPERNAQLAERKRARLRVLCSQQEIRRRRGDYSPDRLARFDATISELNDEIRDLTA